MLPNIFKSSGSLSNLIFKKIFSKCWAIYKVKCKKKSSSLQGFLGLQGFLIYWLNVLAEFRSVSFENK